MVEAAAPLPLVSSIYRVLCKGQPLWRGGITSGQRTKQHPEILDSFLRTGFDIFSAWLLAVLGRLVLLSFFLSFSLSCCLSYISLHMYQ